MEPDELRQPLFESPGWKGIRVTADDLGELQDLCDESVDYYRLITGSPPGPAEANFLFHAAPDDTNPEDKVLVGFYDEHGVMFGVLDTVPDYPSEGTWTIGLLLLTPKARRRGLGSKIFCTFEDWAYENGARRVELSVAEQNQAAYDFWITVGFEEFERLPPRVVGSRQTVIIRMQQMLAGPSK